MNDDNESPTEAGMAGAQNSVERYLAGETANGDAATFARLDAVIALTPKLAGSADVGWAFDEARELARSDPRRKSAEYALTGWASRWLLSPGVAWGAACTLAVALVFALQTDAPERSGDGETVAGDGATGQAPPPSASTAQTSATARPTTVQNITFAPIVVSTELAQALAEVRPVVLLADQTPVDSRSLAMMPFTATANSNLTSRDPLTAESIYTQVYRQLAAIPGLYLIDPSTAAIYAGSELTAAEIAQQLGVRGILEGNVDAINGNIHFSLNFTDAATAGSSINRSLERPTAEAAFLQNDIASSVLDALARTPPPEQSEQVL